MMSMWQKLAGILGVRDDQVEDALKSEKRAKLQLNRRGFLQAAGALAVQQIVPPLPLPAVPESTILVGDRVYTFPGAGELTPPWSWGVIGASMVLPMYVMMKYAIAEGT